MSAGPGLLLKAKLHVHHVALEKTAGAPGTTWSKPLGPKVSNFCCTRRNYNKQLQGRLTLNSDLLCPASASGPCN